MKLFKLHCAAALALFFTGTIEAQSLQYNRFATTPDGQQVNGNTITNVQGSSIAMPIPTVITNSQGSISLDGGAITTDGHGSITAANVNAFVLSGALSAASLTGTLPPQHILYAETNFDNRPWTNQSVGGIYANQFTGPLAGNAASATTATTAGAATNLVQGSAVTNVSLVGTVSLNGGSISTNIAYYSTNHSSSFGAYPNGYLYDGISCTNGSLMVSISTPTAGAPTITSAMVGWRIVINYGGIYGRQFQDTISNVYSSSVIGLYHSPVNGLTNFSYMAICPTNSELTNQINLQAWLNSATNNVDTRLVLDPPAYFTQVLGSNSVGQVYMLTTNWQNYSQNNAVLMLPPYQGHDLRYLSAKPEIDIEGSFTYDPWSESGVNSFISVPPNETVLFIDGVGNDHVAANAWHGNVFFDTRNYINNTVSSENPSSGGGIPGNSVKLKVRNIGIIQSYDSDFYTWDFEGLQENSEWDNCVVLGGSVDSSAGLGTSYERGLGNFCRGTNGVAFVPPASFFGTYNWANQDYIYGCYGALGQGILNCGYINVNNCSNAVEFGNSAGIVMNLQGLAVDAFNVIHNRFGVQQPMATFNANIIEVSSGTLPAGYNVNVICDDYFNSDQVHDMFFGCNGLVSYSTNQNNAVNSINPYAWNWYNNGNNGMIVQLWGARGPTYLNGSVGFSNIVATGSANVSSTVYAGGEQVTNQVIFWGSGTTVVEFGASLCMIGWGPGNLFQSGYYSSSFGPGIASGSWTVRANGYTDGVTVQPDDTVIIHTNLTLLSGTIQGNGSGITNITGVGGIASSNLLGCTTGTNCVLYSIPSGTTNTYQVFGYINVTSVSLDVIQPKIVYTDERGTVTALSLGGSISAIADNSFGPYIIRAKGGTTLFVTNSLTTGTGSITYDVGEHLVGVSGNQ